MSQITNDVNAIRKEYKERKSGRLRLQETFDNAHPTTEHWWSRFLPSPEVLDVSGRQVNGFVVPTWAAAVILSALIGSVGFLYNQISNQRDMLIRLDTQLQERDRHEAEYRQEFKDKQELQQVYINDLNKQLVRIQSVLTPSQVRAIQSKRLQEN